MMRMLTFARRCAKEILRDPLNLGFGLGFPLVLLLLLSTIQKNIPMEVIFRLLVMVMIFMWNLQKRELKLLQMKMKYNI